jgi:hypothetical protein
MNLRFTRPRSLWLLMATYAFASLLHFAHNAEYIAYYPNMPAWVTREHVYLVWFGNTAFGLAGLALHLAGRRLAALLFIAAWGALGLDGLGHYTLALCSQHTLAMNFTILFEVAAGATLALVALSRLRVPRLPGPSL